MATIIQPIPVSLCRLAPAFELYIRALGKAGNFTFYTVSGRKNPIGKFETVFKLRVNEIEQEATLINNNWEELVRSEGGLQTMTEPMRVFSTQRYDKTAEITHLHLQDNLERRHDEQLVWDFKSFQPGRNSPIGILRQKNSGQQAAWLVSIFFADVSSSISLLYHDESLTNWERAITIMGVLKLAYCLFKVHKIPMPTQLPHLMPPGLTSSPTECLHEIKSVILRMSCRGKDNQEIVEVLDSVTYKVILIHILVNGVHYFLDDFGQKIFSAVGFPVSTVISFNGCIIGTTEPGRIISAKQGVSYNILLEYSYHDFARWTVSHCMYNCSYPMICITKSYLDSNYLYHCNGLSCLQNDVKALALSRAMQQVVCLDRVWRNVAFPYVDSYPFRPT